MKEPVSPNKENLQKWVAALRSGKYKQGREKLKQPGLIGEPKYCCLGVACDISEVGSWDNLFYRVGDEFHSGKLPSAVAQWLGVESNPTLFSELVGRPSSAIELNDKFMNSFTGIADAIERTYLQADGEAGP